MKFQKKKRRRKNLFLIQKNKNILNSLKYFLKQGLMTLSFKFKKKKKKK